MKKIIITKKWTVKYLIILLFVGIFPLSAIAGNENDTIVCHEKNTSFYVVKHKRIFKNKKYYNDLFFDFGYNQLDKRNMFTNAEHASAVYFPKLRNSASKSFSIYAMFGRKISGAVSIMSGIGIDWMNFRFSKEVTVREINDVATQVPVDYVVNTFATMQKSKLTGSYLSVPLLLKVRFHRFFIAAGVSGGLNIGSHTKIVFNDTNGKKQTFKDYNIHLATFRYGCSVRAGFNILSLFANYYLTPLFNRNEGPQVYPFAMGISIKL
jgi:hypothetical protein